MGRVDRVSMVLETGEGGLCLS